MNKVKIFAPAKVNFTLDILGVSQGFHNIKSLVSTLSLGDSIILKKRKDKMITITQKGITFDCPLEQNNAYKSAKLFMESFDTCGVDIIIKKRILLGGGLGGSSADICAVLKGMKKLYQINEDLVPLANQLGSDTAYMLNGGLAVIEGRGEIVTPIKKQKDFYLLLLGANSGVTSGECYKKFDSIGKTHPEATDRAVENLKKGDYKGFISSLKNDLYAPAESLCDEIGSNLKLLQEHGDCFMTGSGSVTVGIYPDKRSRNKAYRKLLSKVKTKLIKTKTK